MIELAKTIELDERIPFISKLRRVAVLNFNIDEFKAAELELLEHVDWNPQFTTTLEFVNFFLSQGVVFSSDDFFNEEDEKEPLKENIHHANKQTAKPVIQPGSTNSSATKKLSQKENDENVFSTEEGVVRNPVLSLNKKPSIIGTFKPMTTKLGSFPDSKVLEIVAQIEASATKLCNAVVKSKDLITFKGELTLL